MKEWPGSDPVSEAVSRRTERNSGDVNKYVIGNFSLCISFKEKLFLLIPL